MKNATIILERKPAWADSLRAYKIVLDGEPTSTIREGMSRSFELQPGHHEIFLTIDWCISKRVSVDLAPGARVHLICQGRNALFTLYNMAFRANDYIKLS